MLIFPSIQIRDGRSVFAVRGEPGTESFYPSDPVLLARLWRRENAKALHIVDHDAIASGKPSNLDALRAIVQAEDVKIPIQVCGGIRTYEHARTLLEDVGVSRIVLTTGAIEQPDLLERLIRDFGSTKIVAGYEMRGGVLCAGAGTRRYESSPGEYLRRLKNEGVQRILYMDLDALDGQTLLDLPRAVSFACESGFSVTLGGGIWSYPDLKAAQAALPRKIDSAILDRPLYENIFACQALWRSVEARLIQKGTLLPVS
jgi:phosphoribosylformimino-5-aminoimidazole carboxamide ribotide isomerase